MPVVSVIMPVYNKEEYVARAIDSLLAQSFQNFELIIVNDGSTDRSGEICAQNAAGDPRIILIHTENHGVSHARNEGLRRAGGQYITYMDADDVMEKKMLQDFSTIAAEKNPQMIFSGITKVGEDGSETEFLPKKQGLFSMDEIYKDMAVVQKETGLFGCCVSKWIRRDIVEGIWFDEKLCLAEDLEYYLRVYNELDSIFFVNQSYYYYYQSMANSTGATNSYQIDYEAQLKIRMCFADLLKRHGVFWGENKRILESQVNSYIVFCLFYHKCKTYSEFKNLFQRVSKREIRRIAYGDMASLFLPVYFLHKAGLPWLCYNYIRFYRKIRGIKV